MQQLLLDMSIVFYDMQFQIIPPKHEKECQINKMMSRNAQNLISNDGFKIDFCLRPNMTSKLLTIINGVEKKISNLVQRVQKSF